MLKKIVVAVVLAGGALGWLALQQARVEPLVVSGYLESERIRLGSRVGGRVAQVMVQEGDRIAVGDELVRIEAFDLEARLMLSQAQLDARRAAHAKLAAGNRKEDVTQAEARRDGQAAALNRLRAGPRDLEITIGRRQAEEAEANYDLARVEFERMTKLSKSGTVSAEEVDRARRGMVASLASLEAARAQLALLEEGTRTEEIAAAEAALAEAEAALAAVRAGFRDEDVAAALAEVRAAEANVEIVRSQLDELVVRSPCDCVVEAIDLDPGDLVSPNAPTVSVLDRTRLWVRAYVPEENLGQLALGMLVPLVVDGIEQRFTGRLSFISAEAEFTPRNVQTPAERKEQVFRIKVTIDEPPEALRAGMICDVLLDEARPGE